MKAFSKFVAEKGLNAPKVVEAMLQGLVSGKSFILVDGPGDDPVGDVLQERVDAIKSGRRMPEPRPLGLQRMLMGSKL